jgi:sRNA-binding protein
MVGSFSSVDDARKFLDPKVSGRKRGRPTKEISAKIAEAKLIVKAADAAEKARKAEEAKQAAEAAVLAAQQKPETPAETPAPAPEASAPVTETVTSTEPVATGN